MNKTKKELVAEINSLPGPEVTLRPRKETLEEILRERLEEQEDGRSLTKIKWIMGIAFVFAIVVVITTVQ